MTSVPCPVTVSGTAPPRISPRRSACGLPTIGWGSAAPWPHEARATILGGPLAPPWPRTVGEMATPASLQRPCPDPTAGGCRPSRSSRVHPSILGPVQGAAQGREIKRPYTNSLSPGEAFLHRAPRQRQSGTHSLWGGPWRRHWTPTRVSMPLGPHHVTTSSCSAAHAGRCHRQAPPALLAALPNPPGTSQPLRWR